MSLILGCIADDFTGATDLANNLVQAGMRVVQSIGVPDEPIDGVDAVVIALKSRTSPVDQAISESLDSAKWLRAQGARRLYFKICSTFDSTPAGNIGPVAEALANWLGAAFVPVTPAFPANGRTVYQGHLFVGDTLLGESSMRHHPLTPMTESNLVQVLQAQLRDRKVGLVPHDTVCAGPEALRQCAWRLVAQGRSMGIVDTVNQSALDVLAAAIASEDWPLMVAGSGLALSLPAALGCEANAHAQDLPEVGGASAIVSGSCSAATNAQVAAFIAAGGPAFAIDAMRLDASQSLVNEALAWAAPRLGQAPVLIYSTAMPETVRAVQIAMGEATAGDQVEQALSQIASGLVALGVRRLIVAGGETSGACVKALGIRTLRIGPQIDPGVPWCHAEPANLRIALKSGNFGTVDFFHKAFLTP